MDIYYKCLKEDSSDTAIKNYVRDFFDEKINGLDIATPLKIRLKEKAFRDYALYTYLPVNIYINGLSKTSLVSVARLSFASYLYYFATIYYDKINDHQICENGLSSNYFSKDDMHVVQDYATKELTFLIRDEAFWYEFDSVRNFMNHRPYYDMIHNIYGDNSMSLHYFNTKNKQLSIQCIHHELISRLKDKNVILDDELEREYLEFLQYKQKCLSHADSLVSKYDRKDYSYISKINEKTQVCLNDCYIDCLYYTLPWDEIYKTDDIIKESDVTLYKKASVKSSRHYALFMYTPFDHSIYTVFINNICAYVVQNVLNREFQTISSVANGINRLLRTESKSYDKTFEFAISIISKLNTYGIIKFIN